MTDVWELAAYVEAHPANHSQRWRLAKKLYTTWEYRLALEHLLILKNETEPRANVVRYLAATYYRLGRYDEAARALQEGLALWPQDLGLREQLARTQAEAGDNESALTSWKELQKLTPDHPFAAQAISRLQGIVDRDAAGKARSMQPVQVTAPGVAEPVLPPGETICPKCGQKNSADFKRCWRCSSPLARPDADFLDDVIKKAERAGPVQVPRPIAAGLVLAALFALGVYCTLRGVAHVNESVARDAPPASVTEVVDRSVLWTRVMIGAALMAAWPFVWRLSAYLANAEKQVYDETLYYAGALLAMTTFALLWLPWNWLAAAAIVPAAVSALIAFVALKLPPGRAVKLWLAQFAIAAALVLIVIVGRHGPSLLIEAPKIAAFARESRGREPFEATLRTPGALLVQWRSSGSPWLDQKISRARLTLRAAPKEHRIFLETFEDGKRLSYEQVGKDSHQRDLDAVRAGVDYLFSLANREQAEVGVTLTLESLLPFTAKVAPAALPK
jgi:tetratricopeptide (TPR) repeat protein